MHTWTDRTMPLAMPVAMCTHAGRAASQECTHVHVCMCVCAHTHTHAHTHMCAHTHVCAHTHAHAHAHTCTRTHMCTSKPNHATCTNLNFALCRVWAEDQIIVATAERFKTNIFIFSDKDLSNTPLTINVCALRVVTCILFQHECTCAMLHERGM